jgi:glycosyltransferase involved in cell wall biosynthesis
MKKNKKLPFVSVCTPTFNRRPFYDMIIKCFLSQTYPKERIEWIIIDDGTDKIEDLVKNIPQVKYYKYDANTDDKAKDIVELTKILNIASAQNNAVKIKFVSSKVAKVELSISSLIIAI